MKNITQYYPKQKNETKNSFIEAEADSNFPTIQFFCEKFDGLPVFKKNYHSVFIDCDKVIELLTSNGYLRVYEWGYKNGKNTSGTSVSYINESVKTVVSLPYYYKYDINEPETGVQYDEEYEDDLSLLGLRALKVTKSNGTLKFNSRDSSDTNWLTIYSDTEDEFVTICTFVEGQCMTYPETKKNRISLIVPSGFGGGYATKAFDIKKFDIDIKENYGEYFLKVHEKIVSKLSEHMGKGLVLLHGLAGTGKTFYIKHLTNLIPDKEIIFVPPHMAEVLSSPELIPFLINKKNSILVIEDAERVITDRSENSSLGVSNILNLTDGILSDILGIQVVATFNMDKKKIDSALLRKGRLIAEHKFDKLPVDHCNALFKSRDIDYVTQEPLTLTEIYNIFEEEFKSEDKKPSKPIGFN
jgi:hypothetical protein